MCLALLQWSLIGVRLKMMMTGIYPLPTLFRAQMLSQLQPSLSCYGIEGHLFRTQGSAVL